jgi:hypothetical protein
VRQTLIVTLSRSIEPLQLTGFQKDGFDCSGIKASSRIEMIALVYRPYVNDHSTDAGRAVRRGSSDQPETLWFALWI